MNGDAGRKLAVLIDAENISNRYVELIFDEAANFGKVVYKRIYADWTKDTVSSWRQNIIDNSIHPIQQFSYTKGKNSSDFAMIIDAMDLLHDGKLQGFCIVSSDSDFTRLASRLRESEMFVVGMGEQKAPTSFISACDKFLYLDLLLQERLVKNAEERPLLNGLLEPAQAVRAAGPQAPTAAEGNGGLNSGMNKTEIVNAIMAIVDEHSDDEGWYFIGNLGHYLIKKYPDFDARNFGFRKLSEFIASLQLFDFKRVPSVTDPQVNSVYIRRRQASDAS